MSNQTSSSFQLQLNIVVIFKSNNFVRPTPICSKFGVFVQKTFLIEQDQLTDDEIVGHCFLVRILLCFLAHNFVVAMGCVTCGQKWMNEFIGH